MARILLIDDDQTIRHLYRDVLRASGEDVVDVGSAEEGLDLLIRGEKFDCVVTDIMMARMDGWDLLATIRQRLKLSDTQLPVIVVSAFESATLEMRAFHRGANGCLVKPIKPLTKLIQLVHVQTGRARSKFNDP